VDVSGPAPGRDRALLLLLYVALALGMTRAHWTHVDEPRWEKKAALHAAVLENRAPDPYQYKLATITAAVEGAHRATGASLFTVYAVNGFLALLALLLAHHAWLSALWRARDALLGTLLLCALAHGLFLDYYHHPYDLWGVAGFCLLLRAIARGAPPLALCALALATGLVWEKHALLPLVYLLDARRRGRPWREVLPAAAAFGLAAVAVPVGVRLLLGADRPLVDVTPLSAQEWDKVALHHGPYVLPFAAILALAWRRVPFLVRALWLHVPVLFAAYAASRFLLHELRSFWVFAPVFTATTVAWAADRTGTGTPSPSPVTR
jgi:hypothetical protein